MSDSLMTKAWGLLNLTMVVLQSIWLGSDLQAGDSKEAITDGVLLAFWIFALGWFHFFRLREVKIDMEFEQSKKDLDRSMEKLLDNLTESGEERKIGKAIMQATTEVCGDRPPKPSEFKKVEDRFHELTNGKFWLKLVAQKGDKRPGAEVQNEPFTKAKAKKSTKGGKK